MTIVRSLLDARTGSLNQTVKEFPTRWDGLFLGAILTIGFTFLFASKFSHPAHDDGLLAALIGVMFSMIVV